MPYHRIGPDEAKALIRRFQGDSFYVLDKDCQFVDMGDGCFNDPALKGKTKDDFIGKIIWELIPDSKGSNFYYQALKVLTTGESVHFEHRCISAPDFHYMVHMFPLDDGILLYFFNISSKIDLLNHLKVSNERLKFLNDELKQFMFYLQHDLRNPLNVIQALTSCIALDPSNVLSIDDKDSLVRMFGAIEQMKDVLTGIQKLADIAQQPRMFRLCNLSVMVTMAIETCMTRDRHLQCHLL